MLPHDQLENQLRNITVVSPLLPNHINLESFLGDGGQGVVYRGTVTGEDAAIKFYFPGQMQQRIEREITALTRLNCPNIVDLLWYGEISIDSTVLYVVATRLIIGNTLDRLISIDDQMILRLSTIAHDIGCAINALWDQRIVHRDLKPSNIMIDNRGGVVVIDLGLARHVDRSPLTRMGVSWGTYGYLSPEQMNGIQQLTCKSDVFALGILLVECSLRRHPSNYDQFRLLAMGLHERLPQPISTWEHASILKNMLHPRPTRRPLPIEIIEEFS